MQRDMCNALRLDETYVKNDKIDRERERMWK